MLTRAEKAGPEVRVGGLGSGSLKQTFETILAIVQICALHNPTCMWGLS